MSKDLFKVFLVLVSMSTLLLGAATAEAAPAYPVERQLRQPDGSIVTLRPWGDEFAGGWETPDSFRVVKDEVTSRWDFAILDTITGKLRGSGIQVGKGLPPAPPRLLPTVKNHSKRAASQGSGSVFGGIGSIGVVPLAATTGRPAWAGADTDVLFIMVAFSDTPCTYSATQMQTNLFGGGASGPGDLDDYFRVVSNGQLDLQGKVVGCFTVSKSKAYYDTTIDGQKLLVAEAVKLADSSVDFSTYDNDGDGKVDTLGIIYAGGGSADGCYAGSSASNLWPHSDDTDGNSTSDRVTVEHYIMMSELTNTATGTGACTQIQTIGLFAHEFGHALGLPDLYDNDSSGATAGVGAWSTMSYQYLSTVNLADTPPLYDAWSKSFLGWLTPTDFTGRNVGVYVPATESRPYAARLLSNPNGVELGGTGQYFLVENRQRTGFDAQLPGCGLLVWHVDESRLLNNREGNTATSHRLVDLEEANGTPQDLDGAADDDNIGNTGDPFPGSTNNRLFSDTSVPNAQLYGGTSSGARMRLSTRENCSQNMLVGFGNPTQLTFELRGLPNNVFGVNVVDESTGVTTSLQRDADQVYRGVEFVDTAISGAVIRYHFEDILGIEPLRRLPTVDFSRNLTSAEVTARAATVSAEVEAESIGINGPSLALPGSPVTYAARYSDLFGSAAIADPSLAFTATKGGLWIGTVSLDSSANSVCLRSPSTDPRVITLPTCAAYGSASTLSGPYLRVDVARTTKSPAVSDTYINWTVTFTDSAASRGYAATAHASDVSGANLQWQDSSLNLAVSHRPAAGTLSPNSGFVAPLTPTPFTAAFSDPDGASDLGTVSLGLGSSVLATYDRPSNTLNVRDVVHAVSGNGCTPGAAQRLAVGPSALDCARSSISTSGNVLTVTWNLELSSSLAPRSYTEILRATDAFGADSGSQTAGSLAVDHAPQVVSLTPLSGSQVAGTSQVFTASATDVDGLADLTALQLTLQSTAFLSPRVLTAGYSTATNTLTLRTGKEVASCTLGAAQTITVSLASLDCAASRMTTSAVATSNGILTRRIVSWSLTPGATMSGASYGLLVGATDAEGVSVTPVRLGSWDVR